MICKNCGNQLNENAMFCPKCGQKTEKQMQGTGAAVQENIDKRNPTGDGNTEKKHKNKAFIIIAVVIGVFWLLGKAGSSSSSNGTGVSGSVATQKAKDDSRVSYDYTYVCDENEYSGTYTGGWENNRPNGEGTFIGENEYGTLSLVGSWSNGEPNGECRYIHRSDSYVVTYTGNYFCGEWRGKGNYKVEYLDGNLRCTYDGEFQNNLINGSGKYTYYCTDEEAAERGYNYAVDEGQFSNTTLVAGERTRYYTAEYAEQTGIDHVIYSGNAFNGEGEMEKKSYLTDEKAAECGYDCLICTGQMQNSIFVEPYRYALYKSGQVVEEGRITNGKKVSDTTKAINDGMYDIVEDLAGDGIWGDIFDMVAPILYDRDSE